MKQLVGQMNMFELLGENETPVIPFEEQKKGTKGWCIQIMGVFTIENGFKKNMVGVTTRRMIITQDSHVRHGHRWQCVKSIDRCKGDERIASPEVFYAKRPTWRECQRYVREHHKGDPKEYEIVYTEKGGDAIVSISEYQKGE